MITHDIALKSLFVVSFVASLVSLFLLRQRNIELIKQNDFIKRRLRVAKRKVEQWKRGWGPEKQYVLEALSEAFLLINSKGKIMFANEKAAKLFRTPELEGMLLDDYKDNDVLLHEIRKAIDLNDYHIAEFHLNAEFAPESLGHRGETYWFIDSAPIFGAEPYTRILIRDITDQRRTEQVRKDFVANASHELRTPMTIILGYLEALREDGLIRESPEIAEGFLDIMLKHGMRIQRIVEDMLMISRLESEKSSLLKEQPFILHECVADVFSHLDAMAEYQQAELRMNIEPQDMVIYGDVFYWTQIFFNLVENALKQNTEQKELKIEVKSHVDNDEIHIWVSDNGIGIPAVHLPYIFKRFYRPDSLQNKGIKGSGIGLSIVKRAVEAHDGQISVMSTPKEKTTFHIILPINRLMGKN